MLRQIHTFLGLTKLEPKKLIQNRIHLQVKQKQNIKKTAQLPSDQTFLDLPLKQLQEKACQERFGSFVSRCADPFHQNLKFLADINLDKALNENSSGIPYTTKDQINTQDLVTTCGFSHRIVPCNYNAQIVELLSKHGCVPYAHTNIPQGLLNIQTNNKVYGQSLNPYKRGFISGGSSGGDAVAVATRCASFSIGSDTAGSIRIPAAFCGVVGFKPTGSKRLSVKGRVGVTGNQSPSIKDLDTSLGFLTRSVDDVEWLCQKTIGKSIKPNPYLYGQWNSAKYEESKKSKKTFGYMVQNDQIQCAPSIKNCIQQSCEKLEKQGHTVVQFKFPELYKFRNFVFKALKNTQFLNAMLKTKGQQNENQQSWWLYERARYGKIGNLVRKILAANIRRQRQAYDIFNIGNSTADLLKAVDEKDQIKNKFLNQWQDKKIDALLTPVMPFNALKTNSNQYLVLLLTFCCFQNVLQMPSGSVPTRFVKASETDAYNDNGFYGSKAMNSLKSSQGLPVGIQVTTKHLEDQVCVGAMWQLEQIWGKMAKPKKWQ